MQALVGGVARSTRWLLIAAFALSLAPAAASAQSVPGADGWAPAAGAAGDNTYLGFIDQPAAGASIAAGVPFHVSGWVVDTAAEGWAGIDDVQVLNGSSVLAHATVAISRPDVASVTGNGYWANSGFDAVVPGGAVPAGPATLTVVAHTPGKGSWSKSVSVTIGAGSGVTTAAPTSTGLVLKIVYPTTGDQILPNHNGVINGIAYDTRTRAELGVGVDRVQVYLDGPRGVAGSQSLGTATQTDNTWSLAWQPSAYDHVLHHILFVYAHSSVTGEELLINEEINILRE